MIRHIKAIFEGGVLRPLETLNLHEQQVVSLSIENEETAEPTDVAKRTLFDVFNEAGLIGCVDDAPSDLSTNPVHMEGFGQSGH